MWRAVLKNPLKEHFPSLRSIITSTLGRSEKENVHLHNLNIGVNEDSSSSTRSVLKTPFKERFPLLRNLNIGENEDSPASSMIKSLEKEIDKVRSEIKILNGEVPPDADALPTLAYRREAYKIFDQILQSKIESEGDDLLSMDGEDIIDKLDLEELKQNYPLVKEDEYIYVIYERIHLLQECKDIETCYKLIVFFAENEYEEYCAGTNEERMLRDKAELEKIRCGITTTLGDPSLNDYCEMDPLLCFAISRYSLIYVGSCDKAKAKEERLSLARDNRGKSLYFAKKAKKSKEELLSLAKINRDQSLSEARERYQNRTFCYSNRL
ncbi:hypothetical protein QJS10_CPB04g01428 [Acorus calamus]|uniref:Uncharacterized protein n=1 Tax=Acorus calamus TaxID=4465 RepID=A0AAV9F0Q6_ACOCL|nr:hypothetical protein QJS10_CPB04g01428 [Acorus calamus]